MSRLTPVHPCARCGRPASAHCDLDEPGVDHEMTCEKMHHEFVSATVSIADLEVRVEQHLHHVAGSAERVRELLLGSCVWTEDEDGNWQTACGQAFVLIDGYPHENGMHFCCYCGKRLKEERHA